MMHVETLLDYGTIQSLALTYIALTLHWKRCRLPNPEIPNAFFAQAGDLEDAWGPATGPCFSGLESQWGCCSTGVSKVRNALLANTSVYLRAACMVYDLSGVLDGYDSTQCTATMPTDRRSPAKPVRKESRRSATPLARQRPGRRQRCIFPYKPLRATHAKSIVKICDFVR